MQKDSRVGSWVALPSKRRLQAMFKLIRVADVVLGFRVLAVARVCDALQFELMSKAAFFISGVEVFLGQRRERLDALLAGSAVRLPFLPSCRQVRDASRSASDSAQNTPFVITSLSHGQVGYLRTQ